MSGVPHNDTLLRSGRIAAIVILGALLWPGWLDAPTAMAAEPDGNNRSARMGRLFRIDLPIARRTVDDVERFVGRAIQKAEEEEKSLVLVFEFQSTPDEAEFARGTDIAVALDLATLLGSEKLGITQTVAYVPEAVSGHAVLAAMACDEIMMGPEAEFGPVGADPGTIQAWWRDAYRGIAENRRTIPAEVAVWLLDPSYEVLKVETEDGREYVTEEGLDELRRKVTVADGSVQPLGDLVAGDGRQFTGEEARELGFVSYLPSTRQDVAKALDVPPTDLDEDPSLVDKWKAVQVNLSGEIDSTMVKQAIRMIDEEIRVRGANFVCLKIDSLGGSPTDSIQLAGFLSGLDSDKVRTVAYVPLRARSDAALIALACDQLLMHPEAVLGGWETQRPGPGIDPNNRPNEGASGYRFSQSDIEYALEVIDDEEGPWADKPKKLIVAMVAPGKELLRCTRPGEVAYYFKEDLNEQQEDADGRKWQIDQQITQRGQVLSLGGDRAVEFGLAVRTVESRAELLGHYGVDELKLLEPGWADFLIDALAQPGVAAILLLIAFMAMYIELHTPGLGIGGFVATVCFLVFFWVNFLGGTAEELEILLFLAGIAFIALEVFVVPGFGIFGLGGGCLVLVSLVLASQTFVLPQNRYELRELRNSLLAVAGAGVGIIVAITVLRRWLPKASIFGRLMLTPPEGKEAEAISRREALIDLDGFVGTRGTTTTQLTPSGKARFGDELLDVMTDGEVVPRGAAIEVVEVHGNRLVVKLVRSGE